RHLHVHARSHRGVPGTRGAQPRLDRRAVAGRPGSARSGRRAPVRSGIAAFLHTADTRQTQTYLPPWGRGAAPRPVRVNVAVTAKGAARWRGGHPWINRSDVADEPGDRAGVVRVTDRK